MFEVMTVIFFPIATISPSIRTTGMTQLRIGNATQRNRR